MFILGNCSGSKHGSAIVNGKALPTIEKSLVTVKRKESQTIQYKEKVC